MTEEKKQDKRSKIPAPIRIVLKLILVAITLFTVTIIVLANVGGNSDALKGAIEDYFHDATGYEAQIGQLNNLSFFPNINVDFESLKLRQPGNENADVTIQKLNFKIGFFDAIGGTGKVKNIGVEALHMRAGIVTQDPLVINSIAIQDDNETAKLTLDGSLGSQPLSASATLTAYGEGKGRAYDLGKDRTFNARAGDIALSGHMKNTSFTHIDIENLLLTKANQKVLSGDIDVQTKGKFIEVTGALSLANGSLIKPDISTGKNNAKGKITAEKLHIEDIAAMGAIINQVTAIAPQKEKKPSAIDLSNQNVDLTIDIRQLLMNNINAGQQMVTIDIKDGQLSMSANDGTFAGGKTNLNVTVKPVDQTHQLSITGQLDQISAQDLATISGNSTKINTQIDSYLTMGASSNNWEGFAKKLKGDITATVDRGQFESRLLNLWGNGLGSLIMPSFNANQEATLNCAIIDANIDQGIAIFDTLFADTKRVRVVGNGAYNIAQDQLKIDLKPQAKDLKIGDISAGVKVRGSLSAPSISADFVDLGKKAAGLLLGTVNPAFLAANNLDAGVEVLGNLFGVNTKPQAEAKLAPAILCDKLQSYGAGNKAKSMGQHLQQTTAAVQ